MNSLFQKFKGKSLRMKVSFASIHFSRILNSIQLNWKVSSLEFASMEAPVLICIQSICFLALSTWERAVFSVR